MRKWFCTILVCMAALSALGHIPGVQISACHDHGCRQHHELKQRDEVKHYDVSVKVGDTTFVVLFTPPNGSNM